MLSFCAHASPNTLYYYIWQPYPEENSLNFPLWDGKGACLWGISVPAAPLRLASIEWAGAQPGITHTACSCLARHYPCPLHCYYLPCTAYAAALSFARQLWREWESVWESEKVCVRVRKGVWAKQLHSVLHSLDHSSKHSKHPSAATKFREKKENICIWYIWYI